MAFSCALGGSIYRTRWLYHPHRWLNLFAILNVDRFKIKWIEENKYILGVSSTDPKNMLGKVSKYLAFNTSIYENDFSIKYSLKKALHIWYDTNLSSSFEAISNDKYSDERLLYYYIENAIFRITTLWDILANIYNIYYEINIKSRDIYYKKLLCIDKRYYNEHKIHEIDNYKELRKEMCELKRYIEQDCRDNGAVDDETWKGNHRYLSDYRNQMTHRNSPNVTGVLGQEFNMKTPPIYLIKRTSEDYSYIINKLASLTEKIESELIA